ncbi:MAG: preprotein translocase subunit SecE [Nitrospinae bacterium]|nr:preprotein translocase subunit SecE [Nitrospinota bacterium]
MTVYFAKAKQFFSDVRLELNKVTWLGRKEVISITIVVLVTVFFIAAFLGVVDIGLANLIKKILH